MDPHIVDKAPMPPGQCLFSQDIDGPWIDLGLVAPWVRPYGYLSVRYVEGLARDLLDMVPRAEVEVQLADLRDRLASYAAKIEQLQAFVDASKLAHEIREEETV